MSDQHQPPTLPVRRALAPALRARVMGSGIVGLGVLMLVAGVLSAVLRLPLLVPLVVAGLVGASMLALLALLAPRHWVLRLDEDGYRVRALRSAQAMSARWSDVRDVQAATVAGQRCVVLRLRDGRTTTIPVAVLEGDGDELATVIGAQLDRTHGYKRLG